MIENGATLGLTIDQTNYLVKSKEILEGEMNLRIINEKIYFPFGTPFKDYEIFDSKTKLFKSAGLRFKIVFVNSLG